MSRVGLISLVAVTALTVACSGANSAHRSAAPVTTVPAPVLTNTARPIAPASVMACAGDLQMGLVTLPAGTTAAQASAQFARIVHQAQPQTRIYASLVGPFLEASARGHAAALAERRFRTAALVHSCAVALHSGAA